jgi:predicted Zn-dependent protease
MSEIDKIEKYLNKLLLLCKGQVKGEADVSGGTGWSNSVIFEEGKLKTIKSSQSSAMALRIINNGRVGVSGSTKIDKSEVDKILKDALTVSKLGLKAEFKLPHPITVQKKVKLYDDAICDFGEDKFISLGKKIIKKVSQQEPAMKVNSVGFGWGWGESVFMNSRGVSYAQKGSNVSFGLEISKIKEAKR